MRRRLRQIEEESGLSKCHIYAHELKLAQKVLRRFRATRFAIHNPAPTPSRLTWLHIEGFRHHPCRDVAASFRVLPEKDERNLASRVHIFKMSKTKSVSDTLKKVETDDDKTFGEPTSTESDWRNQLC